MADRYVFSGEAGNFDFSRQPDLDQVFHATDDPQAYCIWAIQRKWEHEGARSYDLIKDKIESELDVWSVESTHYC